MPHDLVSAPDVSAYLTRVAAIEKSTRRRIANSAASSAERYAAARKTLDILSTSYRGLAARSAPFTVDTFGSPQLRPKP